MSEKLSFRLLSLEDLPFLIEVRNECREFLNDDREFTLSDATKWYIEKRPVFFIAELDSLPVGYFRTSLWDFRNNTVMIGMDIHKDFRGYGLSKAFYVIFIDYLFQNFNFHKIKLGVLSTNSRAKHVYEGLGFKVEGVLVDEVFHSETSKYIDLIMMGLLRKDWEEWKRLKNK